MSQYKESTLNITWPMANTQAMPPSNISPEEGRLLFCFSIRVHLFNILYLVHITALVYLLGIAG